MVAMRAMIARKRPLISRPLFIDGIGRGGKFLLAKIVCSLDRVEYFQSVTMLEHMPVLHRLGVMTEAAAVAQLQLGLDEHAYSMRIGRNINLRYDDASSVRFAPDVSVYRQRSESPINPDIARQIEDSGTIFPFLIHESLPHANVFLNAFPGLRWITIVRDPMDVVHSWFKRGWGHRMQTDPLSFSIMVESDGEQVPWYFHEYGEPYQALSDVDRVIRGIVMLSELSEKGYRQLDAGDQDKVLFVPYEALVEQTHEQVARISMFLDRAVLPEMAVTLERERCPASLPPARRAEKIAELSALASPAHFDALMSLSEQYANRHA